MTEKQYKKRCDALFETARNYGLELNFEPNNFSHDRLNCIWYGGEIATIKVTNSLTIKLDAYGDVYARLFDRKGNELTKTKDKSNRGTFEDRMLPYIKTDRQLGRAIRDQRLVFDYGNWIEYDGIIKSPQANRFIDLGLIYDNILDDNILSAIGSVLDSYEQIAKEIQDVAENDY